MPTTQLTADQLTDGSINIMDLLVVCKLASSKSEARRLVQQGGVFVNDEKVAGIERQITEAELKESVRIRKGKKTFHKVCL